MAFAPSQQSDRARILHLAQFHPKYGTPDWCGTCLPNGLDSCVCKADGAAETIVFRPVSANEYYYGSPHSGNDEREPEHRAFYFVVDGHRGYLSGYVTAAQFDYLADRLGTPKLAEVRRG